MPPSFISIILSVLLAIFSSWVTIIKDAPINRVLRDKLLIISNNNLKCAYK